MHMFENFGVVHQAERPVKIGVVAGHRIGHLPKNRGTARRENLGGIGWGYGDDLLFYDWEMIKINKKRVR
jgi:hypothetical protein